MLAQRVKMSALQTTTARYGCVLLVSCIVHMLSESGPIKSVQ